MSPGLALDAPQGASELPQCDDLLFLLFAQDIAQSSGAYKGYPGLLNAHLNRVSQRQYRPEGTMLFSQFVEECFNPGVLSTLKYATQEIYSLPLRTHLIPRFGGHRLCDISRVEVQQYLLERLKQDYAWETTNHLPLGTAVNWHYIPNNPVRGVKMPERTLKGPHRFLTAKEVQRLVAASAQPLRTIVILATMTGLRIGEILALRWGTN